MAHETLDSGSFFNYLHPSLGGVTLYGISVDQASSPSRVLAGSGDRNPCTPDEKSRGTSGSSLLSRLANKKIAAESPRGVGLESRSQGLAAELCKSSPPSALLSRVLGKRQRENRSGDSAEDDCVIVSGTSGGCGIASSNTDSSTKGMAISSTSSGSTCMEVVHEFVVPLEPVEVMEKMKAKRLPQRKGSKRARRGRIVFQASNENDFEVIRNSRGWCPVPVTDILYQIAETDGTGSTPDLDVGNKAWYKKVRRLGQANPIQSLSAILEALKCAGIQALFPYIVEASWPQNHDEWKPLHVGMTAWGSASSISSESLCDCVFRSQAYDDLSIFGGSSNRGEALHVQMRLNSSAIARELVQHHPRSDTLSVQGVQATGRCLEWRAVPFKKTKRRKPTKSSFRLLDNCDDALANQPHNFQKWPLRREQLRSLKWMEQSEDHPVVFDVILGQSQIDPSSDTLTNKDAGGGHSATECLSGWCYELRCREFYHIRGGILGDAVGYGKTATMIGLIDSRHGSKDPIVPSLAEPYFFKSSATLILVPSNLLDQWVSEFQKFMDCHIGTRVDGGESKLRIVPVRTAAQLKALSVMQICEESDVVICSYRLLFSPVYRRRLLELAGNFADIDKSDVVAVRAAANVGGLRSNTRRFRMTPREVGWKHCLGTKCFGASEGTSEDIVENPSKLRFPVLEQFWWRRIVFDEFHELEAMGNTAQFASLKNLCGFYRWGLTGTPPTRDLTQISVLAQLFQIDNLLQCRESAGEEIAQTMAQSFLDSFARQNTGQEVLPVELCEHIVEVHQTPEERAIYLHALHDCSSNAANGDTSDASCQPHIADTSKSERLLKLCSHFAYGVGAAASSNADTECSRLLSVKQNSISQALATIKKIARKCELLWRFLPIMDEVQCKQDETQPFQSERDSLLECLRKRYNVEPSPQLDGETAPDVAAASQVAMSASSTPPEDSGELHHKSEDKFGGAHVNCEEHAAYLSAFDAAVCALNESQDLSLVELQSKQERNKNQMQPLEDALNRVPGVIDLELAGRARLDAKARFLAAVDGYDSANRSRLFLENALAATCGEASAEQRSCSICLDEDIPREELSITSCAHIFHTACVAEVVAKMGSCPMCRKRLDPAKDLTVLAAEVPPSGNTISQSPEADAEVTKRFGSKLAAIAVRLQAIKSQGEKAIVFCQWEDLKRKIAETLSIIGLEHFELSGNVYQRSEVIRRFQEETGPDVAHVLLLSLEHSASGTNLTAANHIVFVHPMNAVSSERAVSYEAQAIGRCRRWGQEKSEVHCWRFVTRGTIEESITADHRLDLWKTYLSKSQVQSSVNGTC